MAGLSEQCFLSFKARPGHPPPIQVVSEVPSPTHLLPDPSPNSLVLNNLIPLGTLQGVGGVL